MDEVKRQSVEHQVWELEWETAFNIQLRIQDILGYVIAWAAADRRIHRKLLLQCLDALNLHPPSSLEEPAGATHTVVDVNGESTVVIPFDVLRGAVSIHQPLWRLTAGLFTASEELLRFLLTTDVSCMTEEEASIRQQMRKMASTLYEMPLRAIVLCAQASAQLWRRNGFSLVNQIHNYYSPLCRAEMFDRDLLMMQVGAAIRPPTDFLLHIICRFRLIQWADQSGDGGSKHSTPFGKMEPEETGKIIVILAEEMLHLLIMIVGERYHPGVGKCTYAEQVQREVVHVLCTGPQPFSHIQKRMSHDPMIERISLHDVVNSVANFNKPTSTSAGQFHLKDSLLCEYNPFFYHYSRSDLSQAEQYQQKVRSKLDRKLQACPPPTPCEFEPFFAPARNILKTPCLIKILKIVLDRTGKRSRFSSDRLLHRALYLIGMALHEQTRDPRGFLFTEVAEKEELLRSLESLSGSSEVATHADLLWWTIQKYKEVQLLSRTGQAVEKRKESTENQEGVDDAKAKRAARAAKMREQAMLKMSKMQKSFLKVMETENPSVTEQNTAGGVSSELRGDDDEDFVSKQQDHGFPVCLGPQRSVVESVLPRKVTCILCQEEETLSPSNGKAFVCAAYVQKSLLFAQQGEPETDAKLRDLAPANLLVGIDASTCSHTMHYECFHNLSETLLSRERQRPRQQMVFNQKMVDPEVGEYLCPLCKRLSNTAMPLLPALQLMDIDGFSTARGETAEDFDSWVGRVKTLLDTPPVRQTPTQKPKSHSRKRSHSERSLLELAKQGDDLSAMPLDNSLSTSVPSASTMSLLLGQKTPSRIVSQTVSSTSCTAMDVDVEEDSQRAVDLFREMTEIMRGQDLESRVEVEVGAAIRPPTDFLLHIICRFRLIQWADQSGDGGSKHSTPFGKMEPEETGKIIVILAEEMLHLLIMIVGERYHPGVGKCTYAEQVQREVVHVLCTGPQPFSHIQKRMSHDPMIERISLHDVVNSVANFNKPTSTSAGQFHLKDSLLCEYNPFFYHYSRSDLSQAEQYQQKVRSKLDRKLQACPPPTPCEFEPFFAPARNILKTPCLIKILKIVLDRTGKRSRFSSDRLLHRALYLIGMALHEQTRDPRGFLFTEVAEKEELLRSLESLSGSSEVATHADLLWWTIQVLLCAS
ncbi:hypothetical protein ANCCAN_16040 [Ancylostoma caninum]|uniref:E3 ubiquitin-protein ligase n=1 Tax=Ancylostoma caninum TaxID=29170 RepID=A0A368G0T2_ANCCA|nr:hypothetical protein ANCCAN_16040 [Ancylostoma caninum]